MGILGTIIQAFVLAMLNPPQDLLLCSSIAPELVGNEHAWDVLTPLEELVGISWQQLCSDSSAPGYRVHFHADQPHARDSAACH